MSWQTRIYVRDQYKTETYVTTWVRICLMEK